VSQQASKTLNRLVAVPQGALGSTQAPSALAATTGPDKAYAHGQGMKAHGAAALQGTGTALSHAKEALQEKMAARKYEKYERVRLHDPSSTPLRMKRTVPNVDLGPSCSAAVCCVW